MENDVTVIQAQITPMALIARAQETGASIEAMQQLFELQLRWEENEAKKAYFRAVSDFKKEAIVILKTKHVKYTTSKGTTEYKHAELGEIVNTVTPLLSKYGLSTRWEYSQPENKVQVSCFLTHELGYEKSTSLMSAPDDSGGKNSIQAISSASSYLERYTFLAITGLAAKDQDDDGRGAGKKNDGPIITEAQSSDLLTLIENVGADVAKFCVYWKIDMVKYLPATKYKKAIEMLEAKRRN